MLKGWKKSGQKYTKLQNGKNLVVYESTQKDKKQSGYVITVDNNIVTYGIKTLGVALKLAELASE